MHGEIKLKVCGMRDPENILAVGALSPDYMGFIFYADSPRYTGDNFSIPTELDLSITRVGVFVNADIASIETAIRRHHLAVVQLHGGETASTVASVKGLGVRVWKVFSIDDTFDFSLTDPFEGVADMFLFDTKGRYYGGNAAPFNWEKLRQYHQRVPFMLSGGITAENVGNLTQLNDMNLHGIDVNSGAEIKPGHKDPEKVKAIISTLNQYR